MSEKEKIEKHQYNVLDSGFIYLVDYMGSDAEIAQAARVSYNKKTMSNAEQDEHLLRYMMRHRHTSPFEMAEVKVHAKMPIFIARQWIRHRTACLTADNILNFDLAGHKFSHFPKTIGDFYKLWTQGSNQKATKKHKPTFCEKINPDTFYTINQLSKIVNRSPETIRELCNQNKLNAHKEKNQWKIYGLSYHNWASKTYDIFIPMQDRLKRMKIRSLNENTNEIYHTTIKDIWSNGKKTVYQIVLSNGNKIKATKDHLFYTEFGWRKLEEIYSFDLQRFFYKFAVLTPIAIKNTKHIIVNEKKEQWMKIKEFDNYAISTYGRVTNLKTNKIKKPTETKGHLLVSLSKNGISKAFYIHKLVLDQFARCKFNNEICRHLNGNGYDNRIENLEWSSNKINSKDRIKHGATTKLRCDFVSAISCENVGVEEVFDIEVNGPHHNFSCNSLIVHNSVNEKSGRYSELDNDFFNPSQFRLQSTTNKQGSSTAILNHKIESFDKSFTEYQGLLNKGVSREMARITLPLATYTEWYWKIDLHNLMHFLSLRLDTHAQYEIRVYAECLAKIVADLFPMSWKAFEDYVLNATTFSNGELEVLKTLLNPHKNKINFKDNCKEVKMSQRETSEFQMKLRRMGIKL